MTNFDLELPWRATRRTDPLDSVSIARLAQVSVDHGPLVPIETYRRDPLVAVGHDVVVHLAGCADADVQLRREAACRRWAQAAGVCVPAWEVVEFATGQYCALVSVRVPSQPGIETGYAVAAAEAALAVQSATCPPPERGRTSPASRRTRPLRAVRAGLSPLRIREAQMLRDAVAALPVDGWTHGDYRTETVLYDARNHRVQIVGWEYAGRAWRGSDLLALWACTDELDVAGVLLDAVLAQRGPAQAPEVGLVLLWSCVRVLAEQTTGAPMRARDPDRIAARVQARVTRARSVARELGTVLP